MVSCVLFLPLCKILLCLEKCLGFSLGTVCLKDIAWTLSPICTTLPRLYYLLQKLFPSRLPLPFRGQQGPVLPAGFPCLLWSWFFLPWLLPSRVSISAGDFCHAQPPGLRPPTFSLLGCRHERQQLLTAAEAGLAHTRDLQMKSLQQNAETRTVHPPPDRANLAVVNSFGPLFCVNQTKPYLFYSLGYKNWWQLITSARNEP